MSAGDLQLMRVDAAVVVVSPSLAFSTDGVFYAPASAFRSRSKRSLKRRGNKVKRARESTNRSKRRCERWCVRELLLQLSSQRCLHFFFPYFATSHCFTPE